MPSHDQRPTYDVTNLSADDDDAASPDMSNNDNDGLLDTSDNNMLSRLHADIQADEDLVVKAAMLLKLLEVCSKTPTLWIAALIISQRRERIIWYFGFGQNEVTHAC